MTPQDAFHATCHAYPCGCESLAPRLGMTPAVLRNKARPGCHTNHPTLDDADRVMAITGDCRVLHALAAAHSHVCVPVPHDAPASDLAVLELVTHVWRANGNVGAAVDAAMSDGRIEAREVDHIRDAIYAQVAALQQMLARIEALQEL